MLRRCAFALLLLVMIGVMGFSGLALYFRYWSPIRHELQVRYAEKIALHAIRPLTFTQIPRLYRDAVIATEDRRFWWDPGIDPVGIMRSVIVDVEKDGYVEGGSTITQQLVDNTLIHHRHTLIYKLHQMTLAIGLYATFSKKTIFTMYANVIYFGDGAYGLYNASETYFHRPPWRLNEGELALLAGIPNSPTLFNPFRHFALAKARQAVVLENMTDAGLLSRSQASQIRRDPIHLA